MKQTKTRISLRPIALAFALAFSGAALADADWKGGDSTKPADWNTDANWQNEAAVPENDDVVTIGGIADEGNRPVITEREAAAKSIAIQANGAGDASLKVDLDGSLLVAEDITVGGASAGSDTVSSLLIDGVVIVGGGDGSGLVVTGSDSGGASVKVGGDGNLTIEAGGIALTGADGGAATLVNEGELTVAGDVALTATDSEEAVLESSGITEITGDVSVGENAELKVTGGTFDIIGGLSSEGGEITVSGASEEGVASAPTIMKVKVDEGEDVELSAGAALNVNAGGELNVGRAGGDTGGGISLAGATASVAGGTVTTVGDISVTGDDDAAGSFSISDGGSVTVGGKLVADAGEDTGEDVTIDIAGGTLTVSGLGGISLTGSTAADASLEVAAGATLTIAADEGDGGSIELTGASAEIAGNVETDGGDVTVTGDNGKAGSFSIVEGGSVTVGGELVATAGEDANEDVTIDITKGILTVSGMSAEGDSVTLTSTDAAGATLTVGEEGSLMVVGNIVLEGTSGHEATLESSGSTTVAGSVEIGDSSIVTLKAGTFNAGAIVGTGDDAGTLKFEPADDGTLTLESLEISGLLNLEIEGGARSVVTLSANTSELEGTTTISADSTLALTGNGDLSGSELTNAGVLNLAGISEDTGKIRLSGTDSTGDVLTGGKDLDVTLTGDVAFSGKLGSGATNLTVHNEESTADDITLTLSAQDYTGSTVVAVAVAEGAQKGVTLKLSAADAIKESKGIVLRGEGTDGKATFDVSATGATIKGLEGNEFGAVVLGSNALTIDGADDNVYYGSLTGTATTLTQKGGGSLTLGGDVSGFSGSIAIGEASSVILLGKNVSDVTGSGILGSGSLGDADNVNVTVAKDATLEMRGNTAITGEVGLSGSRSSADSTISGLIVDVRGNDTDAGEKVFISHLDASDANIEFRVDNPDDYVGAGAAALLYVGSSTFVINKNTHIKVSVSDPVNGAVNLVDGTVVDNGLDLGNVIVRLGYLTKYGATDFTAGVLTLTPAQVTEQAKALSEGFLGSVGLLNLGGDLLLEKGVSNAVGAIGGRSAGEAFAALGGGSLKHKTGSHVDVSGVSLVAGLAANVGSGATVGGFIEYGDGDYDSHNSFSGHKVKGSGDTDYFGVGLLGRLDLPKTASGQPYLEASARFGRVNNDFRTRDFLNEEEVRDGSTVKYDSKSDYYGLSFGGGHVWNLSADSAIDLYGRYVWTHQEGDSVHLISADNYNEEVKFGDVDSHRVRVGTRYSKAWNGENRFYTGVAWEHEFDGKASAKTGLGSKIDAPDMKGSTGIVEFGLVLYPSANKNLSVDLGIQGYGGKRQGVTGSAQLKYAF
jgi:hypothetical protein